MSRATPPPLTRRLKLAFGIGSTAESMLITALTQFTLIFYNQVRGVDAALVGIAVSVGLVVNAVCEPLIGSWSDRTRSRLGRRHPFMFAAILPVALSFYAVFNPPAGLGSTGTLVWLCIANIVLMQALTAYRTPHIALGGELSSDYLERSNVMGYNTVFLWLGDSISWVLSFGWIFSATAAYANGALDPARWQSFGLAIAVTVAAAMFASAWFTRARIPWLPQPGIDAQPFGVTTFFRDIGHALRNRNYVVLLVGYFFGAMMAGVRGGLWLYTATYYWQLSNRQVSFFVIGSLFGYALAAWAVLKLHRRFDKRWTGAGAALFNTVAPVLPLVLGYLGVLGPGTPFLVPILIGFGALGHAPYSLMLTTFNSALADIADENELRYGHREEGVLYSTRTFFAKVDQALGTVLAGAVLTFIAFPKHAVPGHVPQPILDGLIAAFVLSAIPGVIAAICYSRLGVTRDTYAATRAALDRRAAA